MSAPLTQPLLTSTQLGQLLRAARKRRGLTQAEVGAHRTGRNAMAKGPGSARATGAGIKL